MGPLYSCDTVEVVVVVLTLGPRVYSFKLFLMVL